MDNNNFSRPFQEETTLPITVKSNEQRSTTETEQVTTTAPRNERNLIYRANDSILPTTYSTFMSPPPKTPSIETKVPSLVTRTALIPNGPFKNIGLLVLAILLLYVSINAASVALIAVAKSCKENRKKKAEVDVDSEICESSPKSLKYQIKMKSKEVEIDEGSGSKVFEAVAEIHEMDSVNIINVQPVEADLPRVIMHDTEDPTDNAMVATVDIGEENIDTLPKVAEN